MPVQGRRNFFYQRLNVTDLDFPDQEQLAFGFQATRVIIVNDGPASSLTFSFLRPNVDGELFADDGPLILDGVGVGKLWLKVDQPGDVRVWAWRI